MPPGMVEPNRDGKKLKKNQVAYVEAEQFSKKIFSKDWERRGPPKSKNKKGIRRKGRDGAKTNRGRREQVGPARIPSRHEQAEKDFWTQAWGEKGNKEGEAGVQEK